VRADQRGLQLGRPGGRDHRVGERAEPGGDAVDRLRLVDQAGDDGGSAFQRGLGVVAELHAAIVAGDRDHLRGGDAVGTEDDDVVVGHRLLSGA
jgi:hypothetical protein